MTDTTTQRRDDATTPGDQAMKSSIRHSRELRVWQSAMDAAMKVFGLTKSFPPEERFSMTDQMRRSSRSVASNIAEGWRKRRYPASFVSKLSDAEGEAAETQTWLEFAVRCNYMARQTADTLIEDYEHICAQMVKMMNRPEDWTFRTNRT